MFDTLERRRLLSGLGLDTTYGSAGRGTLDATTAVDDYARQLLHTPGDKLLLAGDSSNASAGIAHLTQFNLDGSLDTSFGTGGRKVLTDFPANAAIADTAIDSDGRITVLANARGVVLRRYLGNGASDPSFSVSDNATGSTATDLALSSTGVFAVAGSYIFKYSLNGGAPDATWGANGQLYLYVASATAQFVPRIVQPLADGSILVGGTYGTTAQAVKRAAFRHYSATGVLDTAFGTGGTLSVPTPLSDTSTPTKFLVQSSSQVLVLVNDSSTSVQDYLFRVNVSGSFDSTFNASSGKFTSNLSSTSDEAFTDIGFDAQGRIVVPARVLGSSAATSETAMVRLLANGTLDTSFGTGGYQHNVIAPSSDRFDWGNDQIVANTTSGSIYFATALQTVSTGVQDQYLYRLSGAGATDSAFGSAGRVANAYTVSVAQSVNGARILSDGSTLFAGGSLGSAAGPALIGKIDAAGQTAAFGVNGIAQLDFGGRQSSVYDLATDTSGRILAAGRADYYTTNWSYDYGLARFNANGTLDTTFGTGGKLTTSFAGVDYEAFSRVAVASDGSIYAAGVSQGTGYRNGILCHYSATGVLDTSFGTNGLLTLSSLFTDGATMTFTYLAVVNGKITIAGLHEYGTNGEDSYVARLLSNGTLDATFGSGGVVRYTSGSDGYPGLVRLIPDTVNDRFFTLDQAEDANYHENAYIRRYSANGQLDTSFGTAGVLTILLQDYDKANDLELMSDGSLLIAGERKVATSTSAANQTDDLFIGVSSGGALDMNFGINGFQTLDTTKYDSVSEIARTTNGKLLIAGLSDTTGSSSDFFSARLITGVDVTPPKIASATAGQTSRAIVLTFSESVLASLAKSDLTVLRRGDYGSGYYVDPANWALSAVDVGGATQASIVLGPGVVDGDYYVTVSSGAIADSVGNVTTTSLTSTTVFFLAGDVNHDRVVNFDDLVILAQNYNKAGLTFAQGNVDYSPEGKVNFDDLIILAQQYNKSLAAPVALTAASLAPTKSRPTVASRLAALA